MMNRWIVLNVSLAALLCVGGCSRNLYKLVEIHGKVTTCDGKPAAGGTVIFIPVDEPDLTGRPKGQPGREAHGTVAADGTFTLTTMGVHPELGVVTGKHRVAFEMPPTKRPTLQADERANMTPDEAKKIEADFASRPLYPPIHCSDQIEPGEVTVKGEGDEFEFKLPPR